MKAALLTQINQPLEITEIEPLEIRPGQALVRLLVSGICGAQLQEIRGEKGTHFPRMLGHEGCGIVEAVGPGMTKLKIGDKVVMHWRKGSGAESEPPRFRIPSQTNEVHTSGQVTTFATHSVCSENRLTVVPHETPMELCALLGCGLSTALGVMENEAKLKAGESVLIVGCGGVGLNLIRVAKMMGASLIVGRDSSSAAQTNAVTVGADDTEHPGCSGVIYGAFDVVVDTTGYAHSMASSAQRVKPGGRFIMVGQPKELDSVVLFNARHLFDGEGKTIKATQGGGFMPDRDIPRYLAMWKSGHLQIDGIITHRYPFDQINEALDAVRSGVAGRALLEMQ